MKASKHSKYASARDKRERRRHTKKYIAKQGVMNPEPLAAGQNITQGNNVNQRGMIFDQEQEITKSVGSAAGEGAIQGGTAGAAVGGVPGALIGAGLGAGLNALKQNSENKGIRSLNSEISNQKSAYAEHGNRAFDPQMQMQQTAKNGIKRSIYAKDGINVTMEKGEIHAQKDPKTGKYSIEEIGKTPHGPTGEDGDDIVVKKGGVVFPTQNEYDKQHITHLIKKGDTEALDKIAETIHKAQEGQAAEYGANNPPRYLNNNYPEPDTIENPNEYYSSYYGIGTDKNSPVDESELNLYRNREIRENFVEQSDASRRRYDADESMRANNNEVIGRNFGDQSVKALARLEMNKKIGEGFGREADERLKVQGGSRAVPGTKKSSNYAAPSNGITVGKIEGTPTYSQSMTVDEKLNYAGTMPDGKRQRAMREDEPGKEGDPSDIQGDGEGAGIGNNIGSLTKYGNVAYNTIRGLQKPEVEKGQYVNLKRQKYTDNSQQMRADALRSKKAQEKNIQNVRGSRGQIQSYKAQNEAGYLNNQGRIDAGEVQQKIAVERANVDTANKEHVMNVGESRRITDINSRNRAKSRKYTGAAIKEGSDLASMQEQTNYMKSRDAKLDARNARLDKLVGTKDYAYNENGELVYTGKYSGKKSSNKIKKGGNNSIIDIDKIVI